MFPVHGQHQSAHDRLAQAGVVQSVQVIEQDGDTVAGRSRAGHGQGGFRLPTGGVGRGGGPRSGRPGGGGGPGGSRQAGGVALGGAEIGGGEDEIPPCGADQSYMEGWDAYFHGG